MAAGIRSVYLDDIVDYHDKEGSIKRANYLFRGKNCTFYIKASNTIKILKVNEIRIDWDERLQTFNVYLNDYPVDLIHKVKIEQPNEYVNDSYILGIPSGEVIFLEKDDIDKLKEFRLVKFEYAMSYKNVIIKQTNIYRDENYNDIMITLGKDIGPPRPPTIESKKKELMKTFSDDEIRKLNADILAFREREELREKNLRVDDLEDHEVDDDYHIRSIFKP